ncbi:hypothetical protein MMC25_006885 [Agyrium rufum]|nr:hypothetical protein [Agyrium rufum]
MPACSPSASTELIENDRGAQQQEPALQLALQVLHNLQYQHEWTNLQVHQSSPQNDVFNEDTDSSIASPKPLISGFPPQRIYVHPDEQVEMIKASIKESEMDPEPEWVLPTHIREKWSIKQMARVFDSIPFEPPSTPSRKEGTIDERPTNSESNRRRGGKRVLLATVGDDSTIVYYIVHEKIVKPRQN